MTQEECIRPFAMLHANWPFLDFSNEATAGIWFAAFRPYQEPEVRQGIQDAIANIQKTQPTVADILEFVKAVHEGTRRRAAEQAEQRQETETVSCWDCNDYGFINIIYPTGYEAVRPCNCSRADRAFGEKIMAKAKDPEPLPEWKQEMLFGKNEIPSQYKLVRVSRMVIEKTFEDARGNKVQRPVWGYVPYFNSGRPKQEIFMQYQKRERKTRT